MFFWCCDHIRVSAKVVQTVPNFKKTDDKTGTRSLQPAILPPNPPKNSHREKLGYVFSWRQTAPKGWSSQGMSFVDTLGIQRVKCAVTTVTNYAITVTYNSWKPHVPHVVSMRFNKQSCVWIAAVCLFCCFLSCGLFAEMPTIQPIPPAVFISTYFFTHTMDLRKCISLDHRFNLYICTYDFILYKINKTISES